MLYCRVLYCVVSCGVGSDPVYVQVFLRLSVLTAPIAQDDKRIQLSHLIPEKAPPYFQCRATKAMEVAVAVAPLRVAGDEDEHDRPA